ncbi:MAG TPA: 2-C-methyl-D-erythritol 2,4-cyclodiphosphate synthase [Candidatus Avidehalobacter gallistercoris]|uniref:2-C-methyl-D-erythritol 2,4-cyclodiphosphate synthase n=1 Tax=Candidatus Avidehalobacter gallistercoris TaxID=2840694 RepID=A0A9D1HMY7_9FIRM|nr:2-C-methyl-D-erythritol 2,4-cyclodiphosphate synthase [Candidatus Avidehalobacter gallistercoris]
MRIGIGYDVHRLRAGRDLVIGGVNIPFAKGLLGHSDADVLTHAIMDALLGAAGLAYIGHLFPDTDDTFKDARSLDLLRQVKARVDEAGYTIVNIDAVVVAERPKLAPHIPAIKQNLAEALELPAEAVGIKATTTEGLGFEGDGLGMSAHAVALLQEK